jgi:uncharacterized protein (TIRG00374 family)
LRFPGLIFGGVLASLLLALWGATRWKEAVRRFFAERKDKAPFWRRLDKSLVAILECLEALRQPHTGLKLALTSLLVWIISALTTWLVLQATGIQAPWYASFFLVLVSQLGGAVPSAPGRLGVYHYAAVQALAVFGVAQLPALSFAVLLHLLVYVLMGVCGAFCLWRESYRLSRRQVLEGR